jgi:hypothetical protein
VAEGMLRGLLLTIALLRLAFLIYISNSNPSHNRYFITLLMQAKHQADHRTALIAQAKEAYAKKLVEEKAGVKKNARAYKRRCPVDLC